MYERLPDGDEQWATADAYRASYETGPGSSSDGTWMPGVYTVREHEKLEAGPSLSVEDIADLGEFARKVLKRKDGRSSGK